MRPWVVAVFMPRGGYRVLGAFADRAAASQMAALALDRVVLFRPTWRSERRRRGEY